MRKIPARWGKTHRPGENGPRFHRLLHHMLDVAAVLEVLLERRADLLRMIATEFRLDPEPARRLLAALTALHDLGKVACGFQAQDLEVCTTLGLAPPRHVQGRYSRDTGHDLIGQAMLRELRAKRLLPPPLADLDRANLADLAAIVTGHHGRIPPAVDQWRYLLSVPVVVETDLADAAAYVDVIFDLYRPDVTAPDLVGLRRLSYLLNGIVTVCDWLGSSETFAFEPDEVLLPAYRDRALGTAQVVVDELQPALFHRPPPGPPLAFEALFAHLGEDGALVRSTWLQAAVDNLFQAGTLPDGPLLVLIEDATGSGKTEAGDLVAQRLIALNRVQGLYAALPTTATADAAFRRKQPIVEHLYGHGAKPQITLAHGRSSSREELLRRYRTRAELERGDPGCLEWTARSSKRALLADVGVGTVDQALLGALRAKHATVRLAGLFGKLLLVDEVHAYDDYMRQPLERLLHHQASLGQSVVLMSATLPSRIRDDLARAFARGAGWSDTESESRFIPKDRYPALHVIHAGGVIPCVPDCPPEQRSRPGRFEPIHDEAQVIERVIAWVRVGQCVLWFRNTVDEAVRAFETLLGCLDGAVLLYHARFLPRDRQAAEARLLAALGKSSDAASRRGRVVVATQAAEQSLDLDADELVTDLAPVDVILQRLGRRRRHRRDTHGNRIGQGSDGRPETPVLLHMPPLQVEDSDWVARFSPGTARIYGDHGRLWLGALLLLRPQDLPGHASSAVVDPWADAKALVEAVYAEDDAVRSRLPEALQDRTDAANGIAGAGRQQGVRVSLSFAGGLHRDWNRVDAATPDEGTIVTTRLGESYEHLLAVESDGSVGFMVGDGDPLEASSVRYWARIEGMKDDDPRRKQLFAALGHRVRRWAEQIPVLLLRPDGNGGWRGTARIEQRRCNLSYDALRGLHVERR